MDTQEPRIGLHVPPPDEPVILKDIEVPRPRHRLSLAGDGVVHVERAAENVVVGQAPAVGPSKLILPGGESVDAKPEAQIIGLDGKAIEAKPAFTWDEYLDWRKTKCRPYDYEYGPLAATTNPTAPESIAIGYDRAIDEIDQATHEFVGEVAELGELLMEHGPKVFFPPLREKLIDEVGDIFFCGVWAVDAWGKNPLYGADDLELLRISGDDGLAAFAEILATVQPDVVLRNGRFVATLGGMIFNLMLTAQTCAGLTCNAFKKLKYQRRQQDIAKQVSRIASSLIAVNQILIIANSSVEESLAANIVKLDARYPNGYVAGQGGGIREGAGK